MTLTNLSKRMQNLYGAPSGAELLGLEKAANATKTDASKLALKPGLRFDEQAAKAAQAKLKTVDPALAAKMDSFHQQFDKLRKDGASESSVRSAVKGLFASLTETQKAQVTFTAVKADPLASLLTSI